MLLKNNSSLKSISPVFCLTPPDTTLFSHLSIQQILNNVVPGHCQLLNATSCNSEYQQKIINANATVAKMYMTVASYVGFFTKVHLHTESVCLKKLKTVKFQTISFLEVLVVHKAQSYTDWRLERFLLGDYNS